MKLELGDMLIYKNYINNEGDYKIGKYYVVGKWLSNSVTGVIEETTVCTEANYIANKFDVSYGTYTQTLLESNFVRTEEEYNSYFNETIKTRIKETEEKLNKLKAGLK